MIYYSQKHKHALPFPSSGVPSPSSPGSSHDSSPSVHLPATLTCRDPNPSLCPSCGPSCWCLPLLSCLCPACLYPSVPSYPSPLLPLWIYWKEFGKNKVGLEYEVQAREVRLKWKSSANLQQNISPLIWAEKKLCHC